MEARGKDQVEPRYVNTRTVNMQNQTMHPSVDHQRTMADATNCSAEQKHNHAKHSAIVLW